MEDSILLSIKKMLGIPDTTTYYDTDLIIHINSVFMALAQLGLGVETGYRITGEDDIWSDFVDDALNYESVKTYVYLKVKMIFDPPTVSSVVEAFKNQIAEYEWRLMLEADQNNTEEVTDE